MKSKSLRWLIRDIVESILASGVVIFVVLVFVSAAVGGEGMPISLANALMAVVILPIATLTVISIVMSVQEWRQS